MQMLRIYQGSFFLSSMPMEFLFISRNLQNLLKHSINLEISLLNKEDAVKVCFFTNGSSILKIMQEFKLPLSKLAFEFQEIFLKIIHVNFYLHKFNFKKSIENLCLNVTPLLLAKDASFYASNIQLDILTPKATIEICSHSDKKVLLTFSTDFVQVSLRKSSDISTLEALNGIFEKWNKPFLCNQLDTVYKELAAILTDAKSSDVCEICYEVLDDGMQKLKSFSCSNKQCEGKFHHICLQNWLKKDFRSKIRYNMIYGVCLNCEKVNCLFFL